MLRKYSKNYKDAGTVLSIYLDLVRSTNTSSSETGRDVARRRGSSSQERMSRGVSSRKGTIRKGLSWRKVIAYTKLMRSLCLACLRDGACLISIYKQGNKIILKRKTTQHTARWN